MNNLLKMTPQNIYGWGGDTIYFDEDQHFMVDIHETFNIFLHETFHIFLTIILIFLVAIISTLTLILIIIRIIKLMKVKNLNAENKYAVEKTNYPVKNIKQENLLPINAAINEFKPCQKKYKHINNVPVQLPS